MQIMEFKKTVEVQEKKIMDRENKIELLEIKITEMREAFEKIKVGKEQELKDLNLIFFVKRKELVEKYN